MQAPCTDTNDAVCVCGYDYYRNELTGQCQRCTVCPQGQGVLEKCSYQSDTLCEECPEDTFSDQESSLDPCMPCTICEEDVEIEQEACTSTSDTVCRACSSATFTRTDSRPFQFPRSGPIYDSSSKATVSKGMWPLELNPRFSSTLSSSSLGPTPYSVEDITSSIDDDQTTPAMDIVTTATSPQFIGKGLNENLIPIYCSILAAVVVGLVAYIVFKRWNSCKQNKQGNNNRTVNQTPSPEGEKLHSDSGISVDSQSLQEQQQQQQSQSQTQDRERCLGLPPHKQEEVEKLLNVGAQEETDWCSLAGLLGFEEEHINTFRQEEHPVRALLSDWASKDCATLDALCTALRKMKREDIAESLRPEPTATSMV
ncbi:TNR16 factor, partial [Atractosteus spatula]|nr:TNR16 factor [Atractosteus spatula]